MKIISQHKQLLAFILLSIAFIYAIQVSNNVSKANKKDSNLQSNAIVKSGQAVTVEGCNRDFKRDEKFRLLLKRLKTANIAAYKQHRINDEQLKLALDFYNKQLESFGLPDCRDSLSTLTTVPGEVPKVPSPLYPGGPGSDPLAS